MNFIDKVDIAVKAGSGGDGVLSFRREKFISRGGPDGGDGGNGGDVVFVASRNENTLVAFRHNPRIEAEPGKAGSKRRRHGRSGEDKIVKVPTGTVITDENSKVLVDLTENDQQAVIAKGGKGGFGNAHFVSSVRQAPKFAEKGEKTVPVKISLELKLIADVGIVGLPNAGKSTLLASISNAHPTIADYPFTTLSPNLGVVDIDDQTTILMADIPGLIEGASDGKGLGHQFLRHIERTLVLVHLIDYYSDDVVDSYKTVQAELGAYKVDLSKRPELVVLTKIEGVAEDDLKIQLAELQKVVPKRTKVLGISSASKAGVKELLIELKQLLATEHARLAKLEEAKKNKKPIIRLESSEGSWKVIKSKQGFLITGPKIESFAARSDFSNHYSVQRLRNIMQKTGIEHELIRRGVKTDDVIQIGSHGNFNY